MPDRPLWRTGTKEAIRMANDALAVQRAQIQDMPDELLRLECERRGWIVTGYCRCELCQRAMRGWGATDGVPETLPACYPPLGDAPLPFEVRGDE